MKAPNAILTELTLDLMTHELHMKPVIAHWHRIGGATPGARLDSVFTKIKDLRESIDRQDQNLAGMVEVANAAMDEAEQLRREIGTLKVVAFVNRPVATAEVQS
jgi:hypothetical protein